MSSITAGMANLGVSRPGTARNYPPSIKGSRKTYIAANKPVYSNVMGRKLDYGTGTRTAPGGRNRRRKKSRRKSRRKSRKKRKRVNKRRRSRKRRR